MPKVITPYQKNLDPKEKMRNKMNKYGDFFLGGGGNEVFFAIWPISSHVGVQMGWEVVRLITLIGLNKFLDSMTSTMSLTKFSRTTFR